MPRATCNAVYNSIIPAMRIPPPRFQRAAAHLLTLLSLFLHMFLLPQAQAWADNWTGPEAQLATKIAAVTGPGAIAVDVTNRSSLRQSDVDEIRRGLLLQLAILGVHFVNAEQAAAGVRVFLSQDLRDYVWVAEIRQGTNEPAIVMVSLSRPETHAAGHEEPPMTVHKALLLSQADRILDVAVLDGPPAHMVVLDSNGVTIYKLQDSRWQADQSLPVAHSRPWPCDLRGRLVLRKDHLFDVFLPGISCRSTGSGALTINCYDSDDPWPLGTDQFSLNGFFTPARNYFTGALAPGVGRQATTTAFYSAGALPREKYTLWLFSAVDGRVHLLDGISDQIAGKLGWGSDIASVHSGCGLGWQILATASGDTGSDTVRAFEVIDRDPVVMSPPAEFDGVITAMWAESDGNSAIAVSRNSETGRYEAFRLNIACGH